MRAQKQNAPEDRFLFKETAEWLTDRLRDFTRIFPDAADLSGESLQNFIPPGRIRRLWRMQPFMGEKVDLLGDEERLPFGQETLDCILSHLSLHWVNDLPGTLLQIRFALKPDGLLLASMLGGQTLDELRQALTEAESEISGGCHPRIAPMADLRQTAGLLQRAGFALPVIDSQILEATYRNLWDLLRDLRRMGETNILHERPKYFTRRALFNKAEEIYQRRFSLPGGRLKATFEIFFLTGWAPGPGQQKPLKRGTGTMPLGKFLQDGDL